MPTIQDSGVDRLVDSIPNYQDDLSLFAEWLAGKAAEWGDLPRPYLAGADGPVFDPAARLIEFDVLCGTGDELAAVVRIMTAGAPVASIRKTFDDNYAKVRRTFGTHVVLEAWTSREQVCEQIADGTETVEIADPDAPKITVERTRYRWECKPILQDVAL